MLPLTQTPGERNPSIVEDPNEGEMGRPFATEIAALQDTYAWSLLADVGPIADAIGYLRNLPLVAIGSGGSLTAAQYCADLHQRMTGQLAKAMTPLEVVGLGGPPAGCAVVIYTARGRNADIRAAIDAAIAAEPPVLLLMTGDPRSPSSAVARRACFPYVVGLEIPSGRDGFLATNSLFAFCTLTYRAYWAAGIAVEPLPNSWSHFAGGLAAAVATAPLLVAAGSVVALHGHDTRAAAMDFESKCTEAGLVHVQVADYRNFAHGRHHWLARHPSSVVLAIVSPSDRVLATRTLRLLPLAVPSVQLQVDLAGPIAALQALISLMQIVQELAAERGIDPGRPGVPDFGRRLYSLNAIHTAKPKRDRALNTWASIAIRRKAQTGVAALQAAGGLRAWREAHVDAVRTLETSRFGAIVFDYDGTLVDAVDRFNGPNRDMTAALVALLDAGIPVGVATGRGKSVRRELRGCLPHRLWDRVLVGYYNGGIIGLLADDTAPDGRDQVCPTLKPLLLALTNHPVLRTAALVTPRWPQITIEVTVPANEDVIWDILSSTVADANAPGVHLVRSSHSIDVLAPGVSKRCLVDALRARNALLPNTPILRVGDRGRAPGNDAELLADLQALSVDETSGDPAHAWNLARPGSRGVRATLDLCSAIRPTSERLPLTFALDIASNSLTDRA